MPFEIYLKDEGTLVINNVCTKCGRFLKFNNCDYFFYKEGFRWEIDGAVSAEGKCPKCGKVELDFWFD